MYTKLVYSPEKLHCTAFSRIAHHQDRIRVKAAKYDKAPPALK